MPDPTSNDPTTTLQGMLPPVEGSSDSTPSPTSSVVYKDDMEDYGSAKIRIDRLLADFEPERSKTIQNRDVRFKDLNIKRLRDEGRLKRNQFMIPIRTVDSNIRREQPAFTNYLRQSRRLLIFKSITNPLYVSTNIEDEFTRGASYSGWETPHFKVIDGSQTHGWDAVEVVFDVSKPLHFALEHVGHDRLIFPLDAQDIQSCELIIRTYSVTPRQLKQFVLKFGFDETEVATILDKNAETRKENSVEIFKCYWKKDSVVYVAWYGRTASKWLKAPDKLYVGRETITMEPQVQAVPNPMTGMIEPQMIPVPKTIETDETKYPIFILPYYETEQPKVADHKGRVFLDHHKQEALTANISQFLNGCQLGSSIFPSLKQEALRQSEIQSIVIEDGKVPPVPIEYTSPGYPDSVMLQLQQYLDVYNSQEVGQVNFAAQNRKDSRKTATEVAAAQQENAQLSSVQVTLYSTFIREVYSYAWEIVKSRALNQKITFLVDMDGQNKVDEINQDFDLRAAGDVDVIKRQELIQQYKEFWPVISTTPVAMPFLSRLLKLAFPDEGDTYAMILQQGDPRALLVALAQIVESVMGPEEVAALPPEQKQVLINILEQVKQIGETFMAQSGSQPGEAPEPSGQAPQFQKTGQNEQ